MLLCGARFRVPSAIVGVVAMTTVLRLHRDETVKHSRQRGAWWQRLMCADVVCCGSTNLSAKVSWGMPCRSGFDGLSCGEPILGSCLCPRTPVGSSLGTM
ncbi:unnamed protein product [Ectocarpus sp. 13 AM-2016]